MSNPQGDQQRVGGKKYHREEITIESLATLLIRLLGVFLAVCAILSVFDEAGRVMYVARWFKWGSDEMLVWQGVESVVRLTIGYVIGVYLILGGRWVLDRILTRVGREDVDGSRIGCDEGMQ